MPGWRGDAAPSWRLRARRWRPRRGRWRRGCRPRSRSQEPIPSSTEAILALASHDSSTAETCAKRLAHSRLVMMMISSELTIAWCRLRRRRHREVRVGDRPRRTWYSLFMITGQAPRSTTTSATTSRLILVFVVGDDRDHVVLLDRHAHVDDELRVAADGVRVRNVDCLGYRHALTSLSLRSANAGSTSSRKALDLAELVEAPNRQMKWSTPRRVELSHPGERSRRASPRAPFQRSIALHSSG